MSEPTTPAGSGTPPAPAQTPQPTAWETWLAAQSEEVRKTYEAHTAGLKAALDSERESARELKKKAKQLEELEAAEQKRQEEEKKRAEAALSETDKLQKKLAEYERQAAQLAEENASIQMRHAIERVAATKTDKRAEFHNPEEAYALADLSGVTLDEKTGQYAGIEEALEALAKRSPHLVKVTQSGQGAPVPGTPRPAASGQLSEAEQERRRAQYANAVRQIF